MYKNPLQFVGFYLNILSLDNAKIIGKDHRIFCLNEKILKQ